MKSAVIVTGLPASGKTTIARDIAQHLNFAFLDKDDFLEDLYERFEVHSREDRRRLSRESDDAFLDAAIRLESAVLVSHWQSLEDDSDSGTPSDWLAKEYEQLVEVCCICSPNVALRRFLSRTRHPSHLDAQRNLKELASRMTSWASRFPLGVGALVEVRTEAEVDVDALIASIRRAFSGLQ